MGGVEYRVKLVGVNATAASWCDTLGGYGKKIADYNMQAKTLKTLVEAGFDKTIQKGWTAEILLRIIEQVQ